MERQTNHQSSEDFEGFAVEEGNSPSPRRHPPKAVYTIIEREDNGRNFWLRLGTAFVNRDDSLTVYLNALPSNSRLHIRQAPEQFK